MEEKHPSPLALVELLRGHKVYLQTHNFPDPDAIASAFGLQAFLVHHGVPSELCYDGRIDKQSALRMIDNFGLSISQSDTLNEMKEEDYIVTIDGQKYNSNFTDLIGDEVACIDHHPTVINCDYHYKDVRIVGACASIIVSYFHETNTPMPTNVASALCYGIKMDTNDFTRGTTPFDIDMFAYSFHFADNASINAMYQNVMELSDLKAYAAAIDNIRIDNICGFAMIPFSCPDALIGIISDFIIALDIVHISIVYSLRPNGIKFSIRSEIPEINAGKLIHEALQPIGNGGGHKSMAGGFYPLEDDVDLDPDYTQEMIEQLFLDAFDAEIHRLGIADQFK